MVFKRRTPRTWLRAAREFVYPQGGFLRATKYFVHRMRRLPDEPHRIARGVFAGTFVNFPPIFGFQFIAAGLLAWTMRGNILAALLCTFLSNPITTPFIALGSLELGHWMLGIDRPLSAVYIFSAFGNAGQELWNNFVAIFTDAPTEWGRLGEFWHTIYFPYLVGSILPGIVVSLIAYYVTIPLVHAYQKLRKAKLTDRLEKRRRLKALVIEAQAAAHDAAAVPGGDDAGGGKA
ncbi:MAG: DUF2062 domain-containing protein [Gemmobacter sp.]